jgi:hypothetical protein
MSKIQGKHTPANPKNWVINGGADINQRWVTAQAFSSGTRTYGLDRWALVPSVASATSCNMLRNSVTVPTGSKYSMNFGPWSANNKCAAMQIIEHLNTFKLRGKTMTLSGLFYDSAGYRLEVLSWTGTADTLTTFTNAVPYTNWGSYTLATSFSSLGSASFTGTASAWNRYSLTVNIPAGANNIVIALVKNEDNGIQNYATQVTFNEGTVPMPFALSAGSITAEEAECLKFYEKSYTMEVIPGTVTSTGATSLRTRGANSGTSETYRVTTRFKVSKIKTPTITYWDVAGNSSRIFIHDSITDPNNIVPAVGVTFPSQNSFGIEHNQISMNGMAYHWAADAELG